MKVTSTHGHSPEKLSPRSCFCLFHRKFIEFLSKFPAREAFHAQCSILLCLQNESIHPMYFWEWVTEEFNWRNLIAGIQGEWGLNGVFLEPSKTSHHITCTLWNAPFNNWNLVHLIGRICHGKKKSPRNHKFYFSSKWNLKTRELNATRIKCCE